MAVRARPSVHPRAGVGGIAPLSARPRLLIPAAGTTG